MTAVHIRGKTRAMLKAQVKQNRVFAKQLASALADGGVYGKHRRVLLYLAKNGPANKYQIEKGVKPPIDRPTLYKIVSDLKATACIRVVKAGVSRAGKRMEFYDLRLTGVIIAIKWDTFQVKSMRAKQYELDLDMIVKKYHSPKSYFSVIFAYWDFFKENGWNPEEDYRQSCLVAFDWQAWFDRILKGEEPSLHFYQIREGQSSPFSKISGLPLPWELTITSEPNLFFTRGFVEEFSYLAVTKPESKQFKDSLEKWEMRLEDALAFRFFKIWIDESVWQDKENKDRLMSHAGTKFLELAKIWITDKDLAEYLVNRVLGLSEWNKEVASRYLKYASEYSERSSWFKKRKEEIENMKVQTQ